MSAAPRSLNIALLGTRGIPAAYGGFETFAEELSARLVERGHRVTVYCRRFFGETYSAPLVHRGVSLEVIPAIRHKYFETVVHTLFSLLHAWGRKYDALLVCNAANSPFIWLARLRGLPVLINVDGIERKRLKWNRLGKLWYRFGERCSVWFASRVIADARVIAEYYQQRYACTAAVIPYGADPHKKEAGEVLARFRLQPNNYLLYVSRLEPENHALGVIEAYNALGAKMPLVVVGDAPYAGDYVKMLKARANCNVVFTGFQFGAAYQELRSNCYLYIQASEVGGTHPALVEAMAYGNCVVANQTPENEEVLAETGLYYRRNDFAHLTEVLDVLLNDVEQVRHLGAAARSRAAEHYRWDKVTDQYEQLLLEAEGI